jgi:hypothetical protein
MKRVCAGLLMVSVAVGCGARPSGEGLLPRFPPALQVYEGEALPAGEVAVVETPGGSSARHAYAFIRSVDGARLPGFFDGRSQVEVRPGEHTFGIGFGSNNLIIGDKDQPDVMMVTFEAVAGHTYRIRRGVEDVELDAPTFCR